MRFIALLSIAFLLSNCGGTDSKTQKNSTNIDSLIVMYPDSVPIIILHGNKMIERYDYDSALKDGAKAFRMDSTNTGARFLYARALNNRAQRTVSDVQLAQRHFKYVLKKEPKNLRAYIELAATFGQQGDYETSFRYINEALHIDKRYRDAYVLKGTNYLQLGNRKLAKSSYETAIQQDPDFFEAYLYLGTLYQEDGDQLCLEYYKTAVQLKPKSLDALYALAYAYQHFDHEDDALRIYREMVKIDPEYTPSYFQQGWIKYFKEAKKAPTPDMRAQAIDSAMHFYHIALQKEPRYVEAWHNLGLCYVSKGDRSQALQAFSNALKYNPDFTPARDEAEKLR